MRISPILLIAPFFLFFQIASAQNFSFSGNFTAKGIVFSADEFPFWFHSNQRGRVDESTNISTFASGLLTYELNENARFLIGAGLLYQDRSEERRVGKVCRSRWLS